MNAIHCIWQRQKISLAAPVSPRAPTPGHFSNEYNVQCHALASIFKRNLVKSTLKTWFRTWLRPMYFLNTRKSKRKSNHVRCCSYHTFSELHIKYSVEFMPTFPESPVIKTFGRDRWQFHFESSLEKESTGHLSKSFNTELRNPSFGPIKCNCYLVPSTWLCLPREINAFSLQRTLLSRHPVLNPSLPWVE